VKGDRHPCKVRMKGTHGFTLIELLIVMVIVGILATGVVYMFANPSAKVKTQAFTMLGELNMARSEAVSKNEYVLVYFLNNVDGVSNDVDGDPKCSKGNIAECTPDSGTYDGYIICVDTNTDSACDATDDAAGGIIKVTLFDKRVQLYDTDAAGGPDVKPFVPFDALVMNDVHDGMTFDGFDGVYYTPMGTAVVDISTSPVDSLDNSGYVILYYPSSQNQKDKVFALVVSPSTGRVRISRWIGGAWNTK
jgi:prepilin-type N-terminal cleavage/methylation domain-containing protein